MGLQMLTKLRKRKRTKKVAEKWQSVCTGVSVISNRISPKHRDSKGRPEWFDVLANFSKGGYSPRFLVTDLGLNLEYSSGTVIGFCGSILEHEVKDWGKFDRVCYAHFMRENVRARLDVAPATWAKYEDYY